MRIELSGKFKKQFAKLDKPTQKQIRVYMRGIEKLENPCARGKPLVSNLAGLWRYRIGDYRVICKINDNELLIMAIDIGHRREVHKF